MSPGAIIATIAVVVSLIGMTATGVWAVGEIRADVAVLSAKVDAQQISNGHRMDAIYRVLDRLERRFNRLEKRFDS